MTEKEFVRRATCRFGDTVYVATYIYNKISRGRGNVTKESFNVPPFSKIYDCMGWSSNDGFTSWSLWVYSWSLLMNVWLVINQWVTNVLAYYVIFIVGDSSSS